jgi:hypothetical protein
VPEVADVFRMHGPVWRQTVQLSLGQLKVMSAIEQCRGWGREIFWNAKNLAIKLHPS